MPTSYQSLGIAGVFALGCAVLAACSSDSDSESFDPTGKSQHEYAACVRSVEGVGVIGGGWIGLQTDGTLWRGIPAQKYHGLTDLQSLGDVEGEAQTYCAVHDDNSLWCWGSNDLGQVGIGNTLDQPDPVQVTTLGNQVRQATTSNDFGCAVRLDNTVWCWGDNAAGQLGRGNTADSHVPVQVTALGNTVEQVSVGFLHACALKQDDTLWCWGNNSYGEVGRGDFASPQTTPVQVLTNVRRVSAGGFFTCAINNASQLYCWGGNSDGHLGLGHDDNQSAPQFVSTLGAEVAEVDTAVRSSCALKTDGTVWCWGYQGNGRLGDGVTTATPRTLPAPVSGTLGSTGGAKAIRTTEGAGCAITTGNELMCWGGGGFLDGQGASAVPIAIDFCNLPRLNSISPDIGSTLGGTQVSFLGANFSASTRVYFDDTEATSVSLVSATELTAEAPPFYETTVDVRIENPGGRLGVLPLAFTYVPPPRVYQATPNSGPLAGGTQVTLQGSSLRAGLSVRFDGVMATNINLLSASQVRVTTPAHAAGYVNILVANADGQSGEFANGYLYKAGPVTASVTPSSGTAGTQVMLSGTGYEWNTVVRVDGTEVSATFVDENTIGLNMPGHAAGPVPIQTENADGQQHTLAAGFTYTEGGAGGSSAGGSSMGGSAQGGSAGSGAGGSGAGGSGAGGSGAGGAGAQGGSAGSGADGGAAGGGAVAQGGAAAQGGSEAGAAGSGADGGTPGAAPGDEGSVDCYCAAPGAGSSSSGPAGLALGVLLLSLGARRRRVALS